MEIEAWKAVVAALSLGGAWGGAKVALNGTRERVRKLESHASEIDTKVADTREALVRIETKIDLLMEK